MSPVISPNKTWAGLGGAVLSGGAMLTALLFLGHALSPAIDADVGLHLGYAWCVFIAGALMGVAGQAGDLMISFFKRRANMKDTGTLIPGHGGLLDRIDALLLVTPVFMAMVLVWRII